MSAPNTTNECLIKTNVAKISLNKFKELFRLFNSRNLIQITYILYMIFKAEKLIDFLNQRTKTIKIGKWWLVIVKYILPIFITIVWIGGMIDVVNNGSPEQLIFTIITAAVLLIATLILTLAPAKNKDWTKAAERV